MCCVRDLIDEGKITRNTIEIVQGVYTAGRIVLTSDYERATKFAKSLNLKPRISKYDVNRKWDDIEKFIIDTKLGGLGCTDTSCQYLLAMEQDGVVIQHRGPGRYTGLSFNNENLIFSNNWCAWDIIDNIINFNKNFTKYIHLDDNHFIDQKTIKLIDYYKQIAENDDCVQIFFAAV